MGRAGRAEHGPSLADSRAEPGARKVDVLSGGVRCWLAALALLAFVQVPGLVRIPRTSLVERPFSLQLTARHLFLSLSVQRWRPNGLRARTWHACVSRAGQIHLFTCARVRS